MMKELSERRLETTHAVSRSKSMPLHRVLPSPFTHRVESPCRLGAARQRSIRDCGGRTFQAFSNCSRARARFREALITPSLALPGDRYERRNVARGIRISVLASMRCKHGLTV